MIQLKTLTKLLPLPLKRSAGPLLLTTLLLTTSCESKKIYVDAYCSTAKPMRYDLKTMSVELKQDMVVYECVCLKIKSVCEKLYKESEHHD